MTIFLWVLILPKQFSFGLNRIMFREVVLYVFNIIQYFRNNHNNYFDNSATLFLYMYIILLLLLLLFYTGS